MKIVFIIIIVTSQLTISQTDWVKWEAKQVSYELQSTQHHDYTIDNSSFGMKVISFFRNAYYFLVSDLDGDNCPFYPSCSSFFVESVKESNLFKASFMFADRFTRDLNFFKGLKHYPLHSSGKFFDPAFNYSLNAQKIQYIPGGAFVD